MPLRPGTRHASAFLDRARVSENALAVLRALVSGPCYRRALFERARSKLGIPDGDLKTRVSSDLHGGAFDGGGRGETACLSAAPAVQRRRFAELSSMDRWWQTEYPATVAARRDSSDGNDPHGYLTLNDLVRVMEWKVSRNKWRPLVGCRSWGGRDRGRLESDD